MSAINRQHDLVVRLPIAIEASQGNHPANREVEARISFNPKNSPFPENVSCISMIFRTTIFSNKEEHQIVSVENVEKKDEVVAFYLLGSDYADQLQKSESRVSRKVMEGYTRSIMNGDIEIKGLVSYQLPDESTIYRLKFVTIQPTMVAKIKSTLWSCLPRWHQEKEFDFLGTKLTEEDRGKVRENAEKVILDIKELEKKFDYYAGGYQKDTKILDGALAALKVRREECEKEEISAREVFWSLFKTASPPPVNPDQPYGERGDFSFGSILEFIKSIEVSTLPYCSSKLIIITNQNLELDKASEAFTLINIQDYLGQQGKFTLEEGGILPSLCLRNKLKETKSLKILFYFTWAQMGIGNGGEVIQAITAVLNFFLDFVINMEPENIDERVCIIVKDPQGSVKEVLSGIVETFKDQNKDETQVLKKFIGRLDHILCHDLQRVKVFCSSRVESFSGKVHVAKAVHGDLIRRWYNLQNELSLKIQEIKEKDEEKRTLELEEASIRQDRAKAIEAKVRGLGKLFKDCNLSAALVSSIEQEVAVLFDERECAALKENKAVFRESLEGKEGLESSRASRLNIFAQT